MKKAIFACCATALVLSGHGIASGQNFAPQATPPAQQSQNPAQAQANGTNVPADAMAVVNGDVITKQEYQVRLKPHLEANPGIDEQTREVLRQQVMEGLINERLVDQYLEEKVPKPEEEEVDAIVGQVKQQAEAQGTTYEQFLDSQGQTEEGMKKRIEGSIAWQKFLQEHVSEEKLQQFYSQNQDYFGGEQYDAARPQVMQAYSMNLWQQVAEQKRPEAEIQVLESPASSAPQTQATPQPQGGQQGQGVAPQGAQ